MGESDPAAYFIDKELHLLYLVALHGHCEWFSPPHASPMSWSTDPVWLLRFTVRLPGAALAVMLIEES